MRGREFLDKMEYIDADIIEAAGKQEKRPKRRTKWIAASVAAVIAVAAAVIVITVNVTHGNAAPKRHPSATSDVYSALPEFLAYLNENGLYSNYRGPGSGLSYDGAGTADFEGIVENTGVALDKSGRYAYHYGEGKVRITRLDGADSVNVGSMDMRGVQAVFTRDDRLIVLAMRDGNKDMPNMDDYLTVGIYDISTPDNPVLVDEYVQSGDDITACWMQDEKLYFITNKSWITSSDMKIENSENYYPWMAHNGEILDWGDEDICILGEPLDFGYSACTVIDTDSCVLVARKALYSSGGSIYYGEDWIAAVVFGQTASFEENPVVYTFDGEFNFTGKINIAGLLGAPEKNELVTDELWGSVYGDGTYIKIKSMIKVDNVYRILGYYDIKKAGSVSMSYMALAVDADTGEFNDEFIPAGSYSNGPYEEILWEEERAVVCVNAGGYDESEPYTSMKDKFIFVVYDGMNVEILQNELIADMLDSRVGVTYGSPLGEFKTLISMGGGIYVRYTRNGPYPGGFDVFDFSDSRNPRLLYRPETSLSGEAVFDFSNFVYDGNTFGTLKLIPGESRYDSTVFEWCVYSIDSDSGEASLVGEYRLDYEPEGYISMDMERFTVFEAGGVLYYTTWYREAAGVILE